MEVALVQKLRRWRDLKIQAMPVSQLFKQFEASCRAKRLSEATVFWYGRMVGEFLAFHPGLQVGQLDRQAAVDFLAAQRGRLTKHGRPLSSQTVHGQYRALRSFSAWLAREDFTEGDVLADLEAPKRDKEIIEPLTAEEIRRILDACDRRTDLGARNFALIVSYLDTGLRATELLSVKLKDAHIERGVLKVFGKGAKEREVAFGGETQKILLQYRMMWRPQDIESPYLFVNRDGKPLTWNALRLVLVRVGKRVGVPHLHPHLLRHTFAITYLESGGDPFTLQRILGHETLEMTNKYVRMASGQVLKRHREHSPIDRLGLSQLRMVKKRAS
jgi:site-specific recombinase XerD